MSILAALFFAFALSTLNPHTEGFPTESELARNYFDGGYTGWRWYPGVVLAGGPVILAFHVVVIVFSVMASIFAARILLTGAGVQNASRIAIASIFPLFLGTCAALIPARNLHYMARHSESYHMTVLWELRLILWTALVAAIIPASISLAAALRFRHSSNATQNVA